MNVFRHRQRHMVGQAKEFVGNSPRIVSTPPYWWFECREVESPERLDQMDFGPNEEYIFLRVMDAEEEARYEEGMAKMRALLNRRHD
jgi:hypothetical protein